MKLASTGPPKRNRGPARGAGETFAWPRFAVRADKPLPPNYLAILPRRRSLRRNFAHCHLTVRQSLASSHAIIAVCHRARVKGFRTAATVQPAAIPD